MVSDAPFTRSSHDAASDPTSDPDLTEASAESTPTLSIGDLSEQTGLTPTALRMWEQRYDFPTPHRLAGGHRRYTAYDVRLVRHVLERRESGARMEDAVKQTLAAESPTSPSVFATLRARHPGLEAYRMHKSTLLAMSWAIEDQVAALAEPALLWGAFQRKRFYRPSNARWRDLCEIAGGVTVFADFDESDASTDPRRVALAPDAPMRREWAVVVDAPDFPVALSAWELPGQEDVADRSRVFETLWTLQPAAVRDAARVCAAVAKSVDPALARGRYAVPASLDPRDHRDPSLARVTGLFTRMAAYVDKFAPINQQVTIPPLAREPVGLTGDAG